jgi:hypothetical protein
MSIVAKPRDARYLEGQNDSGGDIAAYLAVMGSPVAIELPSAITSPVYGITAEAIADGSRGNIQYAGVAIWTAGEQISAAAIVAGARLYAGTDGKAYLFDAAAGVNQAVVGIPLSPAAADGDYFEVLLGAGGIGQGA